MPNAHSIVETADWLPQHLSQMVEYRKQRLGIQSQTPQDFFRWSSGNNLDSKSTNSSSEPCFRTEVKKKSGKAQGTHFGKRGRIQAASSFLIWEVFSDWQLSALERRLSGSCQQLSVSKTWLSVLPIILQHPTPSIKILPACMKESEFCYRYLSSGVHGPSSPLAVFLLSCSTSSLSSSSASSSMF